MPEFAVRAPVPQQAGRHGASSDTAHYGVARRHLVTGWPATSGSHDAAANAVLNTAGLAGPWRFYTERFTAAGRWFFWATAAFLVSGLNSLELQAYVPLVYAISLWLMALLIVLLSRPRVDLKVHHADRVCAGETVPVDVEVDGQRRRGLFAADLFVVPHRLPPVIDAVPADGVLIPSATPSQKVRARLGLKCHRRGVYRLQGFRVQTSSPLGLVRAHRTFPEERRLLVYPAFTPLVRLEIPTGRRYHPGGVALASHLGDSFEFLGNREFREGDNLRDLDWRATARLNKPVVREYIEEYFLRVAVVLDTHVPHRAGREEREAFEQAVSLCAAVGDYMARQEYIVDILAAGPNLYHLTAGRGIAYLDQILDILACVEDNPVEPFATLEPEILENLEQIDTIICVFLDWNETRRAFLERLRHGGAGITAIIVRDTPCTLDPDADRVLYGPLPVVSRARFAAGIEEL